MPTEKEIKVDVAYGRLLLRQAEENLSNTAARERYANWLHSNAESLMRAAETVEMVRTIVRTLL